MATSTDQAVFNVVSFLVTAAVAGFVLHLVYRLLKRSEPDMEVGLQVGVAFGVRIAAAAALTLTPIAGSIRGGDEGGFLVRAAAQAPSVLSTDALSQVTKNLHQFVFAVQIRVLDPPELTLRVTQVGMSVLGLMLMVAAVHMLAGRRPAQIAGWVLAFEPANVFFSSVLHKEPVMFLAEGLVVYGGALMWKRVRLEALVPLVLGSLMAVATRPYAGWFLAAAAAVITLHASIRRGGGNAIASGLLIAGITALTIFATPSIFEATSTKKLEELQQSQNFNAKDKGANLRLEKVNYSTRSDIIVNLPKRITDVVTRPYPWQVANPSQQVGVLGTLIVIALLIMLIIEAIRGSGFLIARAGPFIYTSGFLLVAYSLSAGNAGTAFRYRTHVVAVALCMLIVLRERRLAQEAEDEAESEATASAEPLTPVRA